MKTIRLFSDTGRESIEITEKAYQKLLTQYKKFYKVHNKCTSACPLTFGSITSPAGICDKLHEIIGPKFPFTYFNRHCRICSTFAEFVGPKELCPCYEFGKEAFDRLEKMLIREGRL